MDESDYDVKQIELAGGQETALKFVDEQIQRVRALAHTRPSPLLAVDAIEVRRWGWRVMTAYGRAIGRIEMAAALDVLPREQAAVLQSQLQNVIQFAMAVIIAGKD